MRTLPAILLLGCSRRDGYTTASADTAAAEETAAADCSGTWSHTGHPLMLTYCTGCHSSRLTGAARYGATDGVDLETLDGVRAWSARVAARTADGTMPPSGGPSAEEIAALQQWIDCGLPGDEAAALPTVAEPDPHLLAGFEMQLYVTVDPTDPEQLTLWLGESYDGTYAWDGALSVEQWQVTAAQAALVSRVRYDSTGAEDHTDTWSPPLVLWQRDTTSWSVDTTRSRSSDDGTETFSESWWVTQGRDGFGDPREGDADATASVAVESGGAELGLVHSLDAGPVGAWQYGLDDTDLEWLARPPALPYKALPAFSFDDGMQISARLLLAEGE